jgi:hypothetical protein
MGGKLTRRAAPDRPVATVNQRPQAVSSQSAAWASPRIAEGC